MKLSALLITLFTLNLAHASYMATHCSNHDGSIKWETGHNSNTLTMTSHEGQRVLPYYELTIRFENKVTLSKEVTNNCMMSSRVEVFAALVKISTPTLISDSQEEIENEVIETAVICREEFSGRSYCPPELEDEPTESKI